MKCPYCEHETPEEGRVCVKCHAELPREEYREQPEKTQKHEKKERGE